MVRSSSLALLVVFAQFQLLGGAEAGPLAQTARAVDNSSSSDSSSSSSSSSSSGSSSDSSSSYDDDNDTSSSDDSEWTQCVDNCLELRMPEIPPPTFDVAVSGQKVLDSDGSLHVETQLLFGRIGISGQFDHYYEDISAMHQTPETVKINLFDVALLARVWKSDTVIVDLHAGFGATSSTHFDTLAGLVVGASMTGKLNSQLGLRGSLRHHTLQNEISVTEFGIGAQLSYLWVGYRGMRFDVGPLIEGPEIGLRMQFR